MYNNLLWTQEKKLAINLVEQMSFCYISRGGKKCWMDVLVHNENWEVMEQLGSLVLVISGFRVKEWPWGMFGGNVHAVGFFFVFFLYEFFWNQNSLWIYSGVRLLVYTVCYPKFQNRQWVEGPTQFLIWNCMAWKYLARMCIKIYSFSSVKNILQADEFLSCLSFI